MTTSDIFALTDQSYRYLSSEVAKKTPELFRASDPDKLMDKLDKLFRSKSEGSSNIFNQNRKWTPETSLATITSTAVSGPTKDLEHTKVLRKSLSSMTAADMSDQKVLASINCFHLPKYTEVRWQSSHLSKNEEMKAQSKFVRNHWLGKSKESNAVARLWWLGEFAEKAAEHSKHDAELLLETMASNVNFYHQCLKRPALFDSDKIRALILEVAIETGLAERNKTDEVSSAMERLHRIGKSIRLNALSDAALQEVVQEALAPSEAPPVTFGS